MEFLDLISSLQSVHISGDKDNWRWDANSSGKYTVGSCKEILSVCDQDPATNVWKWNEWILLKVSIFAWRSLRFRLPTNNELQKRRIITGPDICCLCSASSESLNHMFTSCYLSSIVWHQIGVWCRIPPIFTFSFKDLTNPRCFITGSVTKRKALQAVIMVACWCMWQARTDFIFYNITVNVDRVIGQIKALSYL